MTCLYQHHRHLESHRQNDDENNEKIEIKFVYEGNQVIRIVKADAPNLDSHHLTIEYLIEVFGQQVESFSDFYLTYDHQNIPFHGHIDEIPILDGGTIMIAYRSKENLTPRQTPLDPVPSRGLERNPRGNRQEESHPLNSARALSRPGNNGGAYLGGCQRGYQRGENHSLTSARVSSRPGNNGEASSYLGDSLCGNQQGENHSLTSARALSRPGNNGGVYEPKVESHAMQSRSGGSYDKIRQAFKYPRFSGQAKE